MKRTRLKRVPMKRHKKSKWSTKSALKKADTLFSNEIRARDGKCLFPGCKVTDPKKLQNSHYIGRAVSSTRFDPDNCIALCWLHHFKDKMLGFEYQKQTLEEHGWDGQYTIFMRNLLGPERYLALRARALESVKRTDMVQKYLESKA